MRCLNFIICKKYIYKRYSNKFCKICALHFNYRLKIKSLRYERCPICLEEPLKFVQNKNCKHHVCVKCIKSVYFNKDYKKDMPINIVSYLRTYWDNFINSYQSDMIKICLINPMTEHGFDKNMYETFVASHDEFIPNMFKNEFRELVKYQIEKTIYIKNYYKQQQNKIKVISKCAYCRV